MGKYQGSAGISADEISFRSIALYFRVFFTVDNKPAENAK